MQSQLLKQIWLVVGMTIFFFSQSHAQTRFNPRQKVLAQEFMIYLEGGAIDSALSCFDRSFLMKNNKKVKKDLFRASEQIQQVVKKTELSIVIVFIDGKHIYRCRYFNPKERFRTFHQIDIIFDSDAEEKISNIEYFERPYLIKEQMNREKYGNKPPTAPPPIIHWLILYRLTNGNR